MQNALLLVKHTIKKRLPLTAKCLLRFVIDLLPTGREDREGSIVVGSISVAILPSCQDMIPLHYNCINMNIVG